MNTAVQDEEASMQVELKQHYGWCQYTIPGVTTIADAAYRAVRMTHPFLTDTNHTYDAGKREFQWGGKNVEFQSVLVFPGEGAPEYTGPEWLKTDYWFAVQYRPPAPKNG
ncbi:hypothetical protein OPIT5_00455 (plasmid) [Opitutaceae bacterium TAV5]|nr:hypothetical protein OPIT5_00455 [Opitutaceae bacterium TAV5]